MPSRFNVPRAAEAIDRLLASEGANVPRDRLRDRVLGILVKQGGFDRARFYESCADIVSKGSEILVLVGGARAKNAPFAGKLGLCVPGDEKEIQADKASSQTVAIHAVADFDPKPGWIEDLELADRTWADVYLRVAGEDVGAIAVDWVGARTDLTSRDQLLLAGIGTLVAQHMRLRPLDRLRDFRAEIAQTPESRGDSEAPVNALFTYAIPKIAGLLDARLVALFEYKWSSGRLEKIREYDAIVQEPAREYRRLLVPEDTYGVGEHLTGKAWDKPMYRVVPTFERLARHMPDLLSKRSEDEHAKYMREPPRTCLYGSIDTMETRYLVRLMNRREKCDVPYAGEQALLEAILEELRAAVDKATALGRTANLEQATRVSAATADPNEMLEALGPFLEQEDVSDALVWCHQSQSELFSFRGTHGEMLRKDKEPTFVEWKSDPLYIYLTTRPQDVEIINASILRRVGGTQSHLLDQLGKHANGGILAVKLAARDTSGVLIIPLRSASPLTRDNVNEHLGPGRLSLLRAYGSMLTDVVDGAVAYARADGARRALGVLGHELSTPLARLGNAAEGALRDIYRTTVEAQRLGLRHSPNDLIAALDDVRSATAGYLTSIKTERRTIGAALSLAPLVAQESADGRLELQMRRCDLGEIAMRAMTQASQEAIDQISAPSDGAHPVAYNFRMQDSLTTLGAIVGAEAFLFLAILNVLRNAYKYSVPAVDSNVCRIDVSGMRQRDMKIVVVTNTGTRIDPESTNLIFEPWVRLKNDRDHTARTGMGIGLFFARRIAIAHDGTVVCSGSELVAARARPREKTEEQIELDRMMVRAGVGAKRALTPIESDESPDADMLRYLTTFEIRVSDKLKPGRHVHEWSRGYAATRTRLRSIS